MFINAKISKSSKRETCQQDIREYENFRDYNSYVDFCSKKNIFPIGKKEFERYLKRTIEKISAQYFLDLMHMGENSSNARKMAHLTESEVDVVMQNSILAVYTKRRIFKDSGRIPI